jgi:REP element-mobilizing transposase RayT
MAVASPVLPDMAWETTRRCDGRAYLLRSDAEVVKAFLYCFAYCAEKYGILLHALVQMENHYHDLFTDPRGLRNEFKWELHGMVARCVKALRGDADGPMQGAVWDPNESYKRLWMESEQAFIDSAAYILANPVAAGLARRPEGWRGFVSRPEDMLGRTLTLTRPDCLDDGYPETVTLRFTAPPVFGARVQWFVEAVRARLEERIADAHRLMRERGLSFQAPSTTFENTPFDSPRTKQRKRDISPSFRAVTRIAILRAKQKLVAWRRAYRAALLAFRDGNQNVEWPAGTWWFARYAAALVAPHDTSPLRYAG